MFERFTDRARRIVVLAQEEARLLDHNYIGTEHILLGLVREGEGVAATALDSLGISLKAVRQQVEERIGRGDEARAGHIPFTPRAKKVLELSLRESLQLGHNYIGTEHILLGLVREGEGVGAQVLVGLGADLERVRQAVVTQLGGSTGAEAGRLGRAGPRAVADVMARLDSIAGRLAKIEQRLGIEPEPVPAELRELDEKIAGVRREKEAAIEGQDFTNAAALRDKERQLIRQRAVSEQVLADAAKDRESADLDADAAADAAAGAVAGVAAVVEEAGKLRAEVGRLQALLRQHGIEPEGGLPHEPEGGLPHEPEGGLPHEPEGGLPHEQEG